MLSQAVRARGFLATLCALSLAVAYCEEPVRRSKMTDEQPASPPSIDEARRQARLLHETIHSTLQVVHHDFYREDESLPIPAVSLRRVFDDVVKSQNLKLRWLAVNADAMNVDHKPQDEFEHEAVKSIGSGNVSHESIENGVYRHAGVITLSSECLKCHLQNRKNTADRAAGLVISIPVREE